MKKVMSLILVFLTVLTSVSFAANFKDLSKSHWAYEPIAEMTEKGILVGYPDGTFAPEKSITRAEFAKILVLALDLNGKNEKMEFLDVDETHWAYEYINTASEYLSAYKNGNLLMYLPDAEAVREDVAVAVVKAMDLQDAKYDLKTLDRFSDKDSISENLKKYVAIAVENNLMIGNADGTFNPKGKLTRAEVSQLIFNVAKELEKVVIDEIAKKPTFSADKESGTILKETDKIKLNVQNVEAIKNIHAGDFSCRVEYKGRYAFSCSFEDGDAILVLDIIKEAKRKELDLYGKEIELQLYFDNMAEGKREYKKVYTYKIAEASKEDVEPTLSANIDNGERLTYFSKIQLGAKNLENIDFNLGYLTCSVEYKGQDVFSKNFKDGDILKVEEIIKQADTYDKNLYEREVKLKLYFDNKVEKKQDFLTTYTFTILNAKMISLSLDKEANSTLKYDDVLKFKSENYNGKFNYCVLVKQNEGGYWGTFYGELHEEDRIEIAKIIDHYKNKENLDLAGKEILIQIYSKDYGEYTSIARIEVKYVIESKTVEPEKPVIYGDVNDDGVFDIGDVLRLAKYIGGYDVTINLENADVNEDGKVNGTDLAIIGALSVKFDIKLPAKGITAYGDVVEDGKLNEEDITKLESYIEGKTKLGEQAKKNADFNGDGKVDKKDIISLNAHIATQETKMILPLVMEPGKTIMYGDVTDDGEFDGRDLLLFARYIDGNEVTITDQGLRNADVNVDGKVNGTDLTVMAAVYAEYDIKLPAKGITAYGDVIEDGLLDGRDVLRLEKYLNGYQVDITEQGLKNADFNGDGKVDEVDVSSLRAYIASQESIIVWPLVTGPGKTVEPEKPVIYGDVTDDGEFDLEDVLMLGKYIDGYDETITEQGMKNADVNVDGKVNGTDLTVMAAVIAKYDIKLPAKGITAYGDVTEDGMLDGRDILRLEKYLNKQVTLSEQAKKNADFNGDGKVDKIDVTSLNAHIAIEGNNGPLVTGPGKTVE